LKLLPVKGTRVVYALAELSNAKPFTKITFGIPVGRGACPAPTKGV